MTFHCTITYSMAIVLTRDTSTSPLLQADPTSELAASITKSYRGRVINCITPAHCLFNLISIGESTQREQVLFSALSDLAMDTRNYGKGLIPLFSCALQKFVSPLFLPCDPKISPPNSVFQSLLCFGRLPPPRKMYMCHR